MRKRVMLRYSSHLNITFDGKEELFELDDDEQVTEDELLDFEQEWLNEHVEVYAYVEDVEE